VDPKGFAGPALALLRMLTHLVRAAIKGWSDNAHLGDNGQLIIDRSRQRRAGLHDREDFVLP
jgi:hypothetical protein